MEGRASRGRDFWKFWAGQAVSTLGTAFSTFAIPLLIFQLTHSPLNLAITTFTFTLPHLLFGLVVGAWVDRVDRKRLMVVVDVLLALVILVIPALALLHALNVYWIYGVDFVSATLAMVFQQAEFTAIPSLVGERDLVTANGRINATYQATQVLGPVLAGVIVTVVPVTSLMVADAATYAVSAGALVWVGTSFNRSVSTGPVAGERTKVRTDIAEGLRYVWGHPVLRNISLMMMLFNLVNAPIFAQSVLYAKERLHTTNFELGLFFGAGGTGAVIFSLVAGWLRRHLSFSAVVLSCLMATGLSLAVFSAMPWFWPAVGLWVLVNGFSSLLNINTFSLRQAIVPNRLLGRVLSVAGVLAFSASPLGSLAGGFLIESTGDVALVFGGIGVLLFLIPLAFTLTALGHADRYLPAEARETG